jgi:hypothetical protein
MLERVAHIIGPQSAAAKALAEANNYGGPVEFFLTGCSFIVAKIPEDPDSAEVC